MTPQTKLVLGCFLDDDREWYGAQICQQTGLESATVTPILQRLVEAGWLRHTDKEGTKKFHRITKDGRTNAVAGMLRRGWKVPEKWLS